MVSALDSSGLDSSPDRGKTLYSHSASLHPSVQMGTSQYAGGNPAMDKHPIQGGVAILRAASYLGVKRRPHGPPGLL